MQAHKKVNADWIRNIGKKDDAETPDNPSFKFKLDAEAPNPVTPSSASSSSSQGSQQNGMFNALFTPMQTTSTQSTPAVFISHFLQERANTLYLPYNADDYLSDGSTESGYNAAAVIVRAAALTPILETPVEIRWPDFAWPFSIENLKQQSSIVVPPGFTFTTNGVEAAARVTANNGTGQTTLIAKAYDRDGNYLGSSEAVTMVSYAILPFKESELNSTETSWSLPYRGGESKTYTQGKSVWIVGTYGSDCLFATGERLYNFVDWSKFVDPNGIAPGGSPVTAPPIAGILRGTAAQYLAMGIGWPIGKASGGSYVEDRSVNTISSPFGFKRSFDSNKHHQGFDIAKSGIEGTPLIAMIGGIVYWRETNKNRDTGTGYAICIESNLVDPATGQKLRFTYMHMKEAPDLRAGDPVTKQCQ